MKRKILFIDRDGTLIQEPANDPQIDHLSKVSFLPGVFNYLKKIADLQAFELVMVTNQDGLGTDSFPEEDFWPVQNFILQTLENEGIPFSNIHIDRSFPEENLPTRKPGTGMLTEYFSEDVDLANSYVIGDRPTDIELAKNLGAKSIWIKTPHQLTENQVIEPDFEVEKWSEIYQILANPLRKVEHRRVTNETDILVRLNLDGQGFAKIDTGLHFFDHMLEQLAKHSRVDIELHAIGDLHIDEHHTIEDTAITLGEAFYKALGDRMGIERYGVLLPMDDSIAKVAIDIGGRNWLVWKVDFSREYVGDVPTEMFSHFFKSFSDALKCNLYVKCKGKNDHHKIESIFKAFARAIRAAIQRNPDYKVLPTTKGIL